MFRTGRTDELEIVGVTAAVRVTRVRDDNMPHFILPYSTYPPYMALTIRTDRPSEAMMPDVRTALGAVASEVQPLTRFVSNSIGETRFTFLVLSAFAAASVLLTAVGLYGTVSYLTLRRTREFGVRLALGSTAAAIVATVVRQSLVLAGTGAAIGLLAVAGLTGAMQSLLYGVHPLDAITLAGVIALVSLVALGAAVVPAWRAAHIDPQMSLRSE